MIHPDVRKTLEDWEAGRQALAEIARLELEIKLLLEEQARLEAIVRMFQSGGEK